ncbi:MAG: T9SS type A sorting domain-containing protein [Prevotella sp.]|jgi:hypothetical protein|nr:T9SS type A sorting domain-containing protein [Prevotella sp.]
MTNLKNILFLVLCGGTALSANAGETGFPPGIYIFASEFQQTPDDKTINLIVEINNGAIRIPLANAPVSGYLEVYSILGVKITSINLKTCIGICSLELPKGLYIIKAGKIAQKIIVR